MLDAAVNVYKGFVVFQPIINGIGGNLVSVQASKISTMLHQSSIIGIVPPHTTICESPWRALVKGGNALLLFTFILRSFAEWLGVFNSIRSITALILVYLSIYFNPLNLSFPFNFLPNSSVCSIRTNSHFNVDSWSDSIYFCC